MANDENFPRDEAVIFLGDCYVRRSVLQKLHRLSFDQHFNVRSSFAVYTKYFKDHLKSKGNEHGLFVKVKFSGFTVLADIMAWAGHILILDFWIVENPVDSFLYQDCVMFTFTEGKFKAFPDVPRRATAQIERDLLDLKFHLAIEAAIGKDFVSRSTADEIGVDLNVAADFGSRRNSVAVGAYDKDVRFDSLTAAGNSGGSSRGNALLVSRLIHAQDLCGGSHPELIDCVLQDRAVAALGRWLRGGTADAVKCKQPADTMAFNFDQFSDIELGVDKTAKNYGNNSANTFRTTTRMVGTPAHQLQQTLRTSTDTLMKATNVNGSATAGSASLSIWSTRVSETRGFDYARSSQSARLLTSSSKLMIERCARFAHSDRSPDFGESSVAATKLAMQTGNSLNGTLELF